MSSDRMKCWRWTAGRLTSVFFATEAEVWAMCGMELDFDEPFGPHSWVSVKTERSQFEELDFDNLTRVLSGVDLFSHCESKANDLYED